MQLKDAPCRAASLFTSNPHERYWLFTDASSVAAAACFAQVSGDGKERPIAFASHRFTSTEARRSAIEREAFAIVWFLKTFDRWVLGARVNVVSHLSPLAYLTASTPHRAKLARWASAITRYNLTVSHRRGVRNKNADTLSRLGNDCRSLT